MVASEQTNLGKIFLISSSSIELHYWFICAHSSAVNRKICRRTSGGSSGGSSVRAGTATAATAAAATAAAATAAAAAAAAARFLPGKNLDYFAYGNCIIRSGYNNINCSCMDAILRFAIWTWLALSLSPSLPLSLSLIFQILMLCFLSFKTRLHPQAPFSHSCMVWHANHWFEYTV